MAASYALIFCFLVLNGSFIWARYTFFRIDGPTPFGARIIEVSVVVSILLGSSLIFSQAPPLRIFEFIALLCAAVSATLFIWAIRSVKQQQLSAAFSADQPIQLLTSGAFHFVRNPFYLAYIFAHAMPFVATQSVWGLVCWVWLIVVYLQAVRFEENKFLNSSLAKDYLQYQRSTGRFLPKLSTFCRN